MDRKLFQNIILSITVTIGFIIPQILLILLFKHISFFMLVIDAVPFVILFLLIKLIFKWIENVTIFIPAIIASISFCIATIYFLYSYLIFEIFIGSPSSTSVVLINFISFWAIVTGSIGFAIGMILGLLLLKAKTFKIRGTLVAFLGLLVGIVILAIFSSYFIVNNHNKFNRPRVTLDKKIIYKTNSNANKSLLTKKAEKLLWDDDEEASRLLKGEYEQSPTKYVINWNNKECIILFNEHSLDISQKDGEFKIKESLKGYDYIRRIIPTTLKFTSDAREYLAIIAILRATSFHSILCIYNPEGQLVYQEILDYIKKVSKDKLQGSEKEVLFIEDSDCRKFVYYFGNKQT